MKRYALMTAALLAAAPALAVPINTGDVGVYNAFAAGATVETFDAVGGLTPLPLDSYANALNSSTAVPAAAQLGGQIAGLHFHSGGGSFNDLVGTPGTPTALLSLGGGIAGDARSPTGVVGSLEINTEQLDLDQFVEIIFTSALQNRVGIWLNPGLGNVTFTAFDATGQSLESVAGTAGNFVGVERAANEIRFVSIVGGPAGFTIDDLTFGRADATSVPAPAPLALIAAGLIGAAITRRQRAG